MATDPAAADTAADAADASDASDQGTTGVADPRTSPEGGSAAGESVDAGPGQPADPRHGEAVDIESVGPGRPRAINGTGSEADTAADEPLDDEPLDDESVDDEPLDDESVDDEPLDDEASGVDESVQDEPADDRAAPAESVQDEPSDDRPDADPADAARTRLVSAMRPRGTRGQLLAAVVCAVLGFAVVVQVRQEQVQGLTSLRQSDLLTILDNVTQQSARLDDQAATLQRTLEDLQSATDRSPAAIQAAQARLDALGILAGTVAAVGPGLELDIDDPKAAVNATDILSMVEELRDAGAEAMQLGAVRVVASTSFVDNPSGVLVDHTLVTPPYRVLVIGDPQTLGAALQIPGGVLEALRTKQATGSVHTVGTVRITALRSLGAPQYAHPAPSAAP
jgi:uncharacterized protein YlxW (UPF0749 family)